MCCFISQGEVDTLKLRLSRLEREKKELEEANEKLQQKVSLPKFDHRFRFLTHKAMK